MIRQAKAEDAREIQHLILLFTENGQMLYRSLSEIRRSIHTFLVCERENRLTGVCSLKYGWDQYVEIRSLAVHPSYSRRGIGTALVRKCIENALAANSEILFALTYAAPLFGKLGFEIVEKNDLPMKVWNDCRACLHREHCDETAMILPLKSLQTGRLGNLPLNRLPEVLY